MSMHNCPQMMGSVINVHEHKREKRDSDVSDPPPYLMHLRECPASLMVLLVEEE